MLLMQKYSGQSCCWQTESGGVSHGLGWRELLLFG